MEDADRELVVPFDRHQLLLLDRLIEERELGQTREEVVLHAFRAYVEGRRPKEAVTE